MSDTHNQPTQAESEMKLTLSFREFEDRLRQWMIRESGLPSYYGGAEKDRWYRDYGLIYHFISDQFPETTISKQ